MDDVPAPNPTVSVIIPCFNVAKTIERAIRSIRAQDYQPIELILVDDGSSDGTIEILQELADDTTRIIPLGARGGASNARNAGIRASTGEFIAFLDADDEWLPSKLTKQMARLLAEPDLSFIACDSRFIDVTGVHHERLYEGCVAVEGREAWRALLVRNYIATPAVVVRRSALERVGPFDTRLPVAEDQDLWIRLAIDGSLGFIHEPLLIVHDRMDSLSREKQLTDQAVRYTLPMIRGHIARQKARLSRSEINKIIGERYSRSGRGLYIREPWLGLKLILVGSLHGFEPIQNLLFIFIASWPVRTLRGLLAGTAK
jgi:glycosyltransferase involved in cell wall biosynthesis